MPLLEEELESVLEKKEIIEFDGKEIFIVGRQVQIGSYTIDLIGADEDGFVYIIELKRGEVDGNALAQLLNYMYIVEEYLGHVVNGILIGKKLSNHMQLAIEMIEEISFMKFDLEIKLKKDSWHLVDDFFDKEPVISQTEKLRDMLGIFYEDEVEQEKEDDE